MVKLAKKLDSMNGALKWGFSAHIDILDRYLNGGFAIENEYIMDFKSLCINRIVGLLLVVCGTTFGF